MAASETSLRVTDLYRIRLNAIRERVQGNAERRWPSIENFDTQADGWLAATAAELAGAQREAVRATQGYLAAFLTSELGRRTQAPSLDPDRYIISRDGRPLKQALNTALIGALAGLKETAGEDHAKGLERGLRMIERDLMHAARTSLNDGMDADPRIEGWQRAVAGTCGACAGDVAVEVSIQLPALPLNIHPSCRCVTQPVVINRPDRFPLPTGQELFERMTPAEQNEQFGKRKADALRSGRLSLTDLVGTSAMATEADYLTEKPLNAAN